MSQDFGIPIWLPSVSSYYKNKILDLESTCCAGLSKIRSKFTESLGSFDSSTEDIQQSERKHYVDDEISGKCTTKHFDETKPYDRQIDSKYVFFRYLDMLYGQFHNNSSDI